MTAVADVLNRGDRASQPAANAVPVHSLYYVTDEGITEQSDGAAWQAYSAAIPALATTFNARLTGTTGVPVTTSDVTAIGTIYLTPYKGENIALYDGASWETFSLSEISLALTGLIKGVCYDIFVYDSSGLTLEAVAWKKVTASNNPTAGSSKQIDLTDTATLEVGMYVGIKDGSNSEIARITAVVTNTSITVATLANSYTTPDVYGYRARATALTKQDGVYVQNGATNKRYCGSITIGSTTGQTEDSLQKRNIWNYYNRVNRPLRVTEATASWNYSSTTITPWNGTENNRVEATCGVVEDAITALMQIFSSNSTTTPRQVSAGMGLNSVAAYSFGLQGTDYVASNNAHNVTSFGTGFVGLGFNYIMALQAGAGTETQTWWSGGTSGIQGMWRG